MKTPQERREEHVREFVSTIIVRDGFKWATPGGDAEVMREARVWADRVMEDGDEWEIARQKAEHDRWVAHPLPSVAGGDE